MQAGGESVACKGDEELAGSHLMALTSSKVRRQTLVCAALVRALALGAKTDCWAGLSAFPGEAQALPQ